MKQLIKHIILTSLDSLQLRLSLSESNNRISTQNYGNRVRIHFNFRLLLKQSKIVETVKNYRNKSSSRNKKSSRKHFFFVETTEKDRNNPTSQKQPKFISTRQVLPYKAAHVETTVPTQKQTNFVETIQLRRKIKYRTLKSILKGKSPLLGLNNFEVQQTRFILFLCALDAFVIGSRYIDAILFVPVSIFQKKMADMPK